MALLIVFWMSASPARANQIARDVRFDLSSNFGIFGAEDPDAPGLPISGTFGSSNFVPDFYTDKQVFDAPVDNFELEIDGYSHQAHEVRLRFTYENGFLKRMDLYNTANGIDVGPGPDFVATFSPIEAEPLQIFTYSTADSGPWSAYYGWDDMTSLMEAWYPHNGFNRHCGRHWRQLRSTHRQARHPMPGRPSAARQRWRQFVFPFCVNPLFWGPPGS